MQTIRTIGVVGAGQQGRGIAQLAATNGITVKIVDVDLDGILRAATIIASNTASISLTKLAAATSRPEQVNGLHFMHPVPAMKLVEIVRALQTSDQTYE